MPDLAAPVKTQERWVPSFVSGFAGWTFDGLDFFLVVFSLTAIGQTFGKPDKTISLALTATLAFRPIGAFLFGLFADRYGRRLPIAINFALFAVVEVLTGLARNFPQFLIIRAIFGIVMGGQWGIGVTLAMEEVPARLRGIMSGVLQEGYAIGYLLAGAAYYLFFDRFSWRPLFFLGLLPALLLAIFVLISVRESAVWQRSRSANWGELGRSLVSHWKLFIYFVLLMMALHMSSHGTQDIYPTFLQRVWHMAPRERAWVSSLAMGAGILGTFSGISLGQNRPPRCYGRGSAGMRVLHPDVGVQPDSRTADCRRHAHAVLPPRRLGRGACAPCRNVPRFDSRFASRPRQPVWWSACQRNRLY